jgi:hypothetical protein
MILPFCHVKEPNWNLIIDSCLSEARMQLVYQSEATPGGMSTLDLPLPLPLSLPLLSLAVLCDGS